MPVLRHCAQADIALAVCFGLSARWPPFGFIHFIINQKKHILTHKTMASYKHMEMAQSLSNDSRIEIRKGFLGLSTTLYYTPTGAKVNLKVSEYATDMEKRLTKLLQKDGGEWRLEVENGKLPTVPVGQFRLEAAYSQDGAYLALQLFRFVDFTYSPQGDMVVYEGDDAKAVFSVL